MFEHTELGLFILGSPAENVLTNLVLFADLHELLAVYHQKVDSWRQLSNLDVLHSCIVEITEFIFLPCHETDVTKVAARLKSAVAVLAVWAHDMNLSTQDKVHVL